MEYTRKHGVFEVVDEKECHDKGCNPLTLKWEDKMKGDVCRSRLVCRENKKAKKKNEQLGSEDVFSPMPPSEGLKMLLSTMTTDTTMETTRVDRSRWQRGMCQERTCKAKCAGGSAHTLLKGTTRKANCPDSAGACTERETQSQSGETWSEVLQDGSMKVGTACSRRKSQRVVPWRRLLRGDTTAACANLGAVSGETDRAHCVCCRRCEEVEDPESNDQD